MRSTHTFATLGMPRGMHALVRRKLEEAGYQHAILEDDDQVAIDMHGIGLVVDDAEPVEVGTCARPMTRVMQTTFGGADDPDPQNRGDCFPACVASLLGLETADGIPRWYGADSLGDQEANWWAVVDWLRERGASLLCWEWPLSDHMVRTLAGAVLIVSGTSPRYPDGLHAVLGQVQRDGSLRMIHDPHPSAAFVVGHPVMVELLFPLVAPSIEQLKAEEAEGAP